MAAGLGTKAMSLGASTASGGHAEDSAAAQAQGQGGAEGQGIGDRVYCEACRWIGTRYVHRASLRGAGADCFGLVRGVWRALVGAEPWEVPAYAPGWADEGDPERFRVALGTWFPSRQSSAVATGDVVLFRIAPGRVAKHLGILGTTARGVVFVHAHPRHGVIASPLSAPWARRVVAGFVFPSAPLMQADKERTTSWQP